MAPIVPPAFSLSTGARLPAIGLGTFGSDHVTGDAIAAAVGEALRIGYRFIDCAACYGNEDRIGPELESAIRGGIAREELFILSKVWNDCHRPADLVASLKRSLRDLRIDYLDGYLVHWPFPNFHPPFCDVDTRNPDSRPYIHEAFMETWQAMEELVDMGLVRHIGTSNVTIPKLRLILRDARIRPAINEMELHPCFQQGELFQYCIDHGVQPVGYSPLGSPARPARDRTGDDPVDLEQPILCEIARAHGIPAALVCLKWAVQRGQAAIPFSTDPKHLRENLRCVTVDPLTPAEMDRLRGCERGERLIKGQVFLWEGAGDWRDLWDVDGTIPGWDGYAAKG